MLEGDSLFKNPPHPLDLNITDLNEIRLKFSEARQQGMQNYDEENGITLDVKFNQIKQVLSINPKSKIKLRTIQDLKVFTKGHIVLKRIQNYYFQVTWKQFLSLLDIESDLREKLLDWNMYEIKPNKFVEYQKKILKPLYRQTDRIYYILKALDIIYNGKNFMVLVFDDSTISIFDSSNYEIVIEFKIPYEFTVEMFLEYDDYLGKNQKHTREKVQVNKISPDQEISEFSKQIQSTFQKRKAQSISIDPLNKTQQITKHRQKNKSFQLSSDEIQQEVSFLPSDQTLRRKEQEDKILALRKNLQNMTRIVDIDPRTLKSRSTDPKNKDAFTKSKKFDIQELQQQYLDSKRNSAKKSQEINMKKTKKKYMFVTALAYCQYNDLLFVGLINQEVQMFKFGINEKNSTYYLKKVKVIKCPDVPKEIQIMRHRITNNLKCIISLQNNTIRIHQYQFNTKTQVLDFDIQPKWTTQVSFEVASLKFFDSLGFIVSSFQGEFAVYMDHYIKIPSHLPKKITITGSKQRIIEPEKLFHMVLKRKLEGRGGAISITSITYSQKQKLLVFGSLNGKITFFNLLCNSISSNQQASPSQIMEIYCYDQQNQIIAISQDYIISIWDIMRYEQIYCFKTIKDITEDFQYAMNSSLFLPQKGLLYIVGNILQSWISVVDKSREFEKMKLQSNYYWREKSQVQRGQKVNNGIELNKILKQDDKKEQLKPNIFVKRKHPLPLTRIMWVIKSVDQVLIFESTKQIKLYNLPNLRLIYSFLFSFQDEVEQIISFNATDDLKIIGIATLKQEVRLYNLYSQELLQIIEFQNHIVYLSFLHLQSEYFFLIGLEDGTIIFCASHLKGNKKLQNKQFFNHKTAIVCMQINDQYLVSISEDMAICIWSLSSCSLKKQLTLPSTSFSLDTTDELFHQSLPAFIEFTSNNIFYVINNAGDLHEYNAQDASLLQGYACDVQVLNGIGCLLSGKAGEILSFDETARIRSFNRKDARIKLQRQNTMKYSPSSSPGINNQQKRKIQKKFSNNLSDQKTNFEETNWSCKTEIQLSTEFNSDMIPKKMIIHQQKVYVFCGMKHVLILDKDNLNILSIMEYETGIIENYEQQQLQEINDLDNRMIRLTKT